MKLLVSLQCLDMCVWDPVKDLWLCLVFMAARPNSTCVWMRLRPLNQRICPRRSSLSAQSISSSSSASSSPSSSPGSKSPASFRQGRRSVGTVAITWNPGMMHCNLNRRKFPIVAIMTFLTAHFTKGQSRSL